MATYTKTKDYVVLDGDFQTDSFGVGQSVLVVKSGKGDCLDLKSGDNTVAAGAAYHVVSNSDLEFGGAYAGSDYINAGDLVIDLVGGTKHIVLQGYYKMNGKHSFKWIKDTTYDVDNDNLVNIVEDGHVDFTDVYTRDEFYATNNKLTGTAFDDQFDLSGAVLYDKKTGAAIVDNSAKGFTVNAGAGVDAIIGSKYSDTITAGTGNGNTIAWDLKDGNFGDDVVNLTKGEDTDVNFTLNGAAVLTNAIQYEIVGNDVKATVCDAYVIGYTKTGVTVDSTQSLTPGHTTEYEVHTVIYKANAFDADGNVTGWDGGTAQPVTYQATAGDDTEKITAFSKIGTRVDNSEVVMATTPNPTAYPTAKDNGAVFVDNETEFGTITFKNLAKSDVINYGDGTATLTSGSVEFNTQSALAAAEVTNLSTFVYNSILDSDNTKFTGKYLNESVTALATPKALNVNLGGSVVGGGNTADLSLSSGINTISAAKGSVNTVTGGSAADKLKMGVGSTTTFNLDLTKLNGDDVVTLSKDENMKLQFQNDIVADQVKAEIVGKDVVVTTYKEVGEHGAAKEDVALGTVGGALYKETAGTYVVSANGNDLYKDEAYTGKVSELAGAQLRIKSGDDHNVVVNNDKAVYKLDAQWTGKASEFTSKYYTDGNTAGSNLKDADTIKQVFTLADPTELAINNTTDTAYEATSATVYTSKAIVKLYKIDGTVLDTDITTAKTNFDGSADNKKLFTDAEHTHEVEAYGDALDVYKRYKFSSTNEGNINVGSNYTKVEEDGVVTFTKQAAQTVYGVTEQALNAAVAADTFFVTGGVLVDRGAAGEFFKTVQYTGKASVLNAATDYVYEHINAGAKLDADGINAHKRYTLDKLVDTSKKSHITFTGLAGKNLVGTNGSVAMMGNTIYDLNGLVHIPQSLINSYDYETTLTSSDKKFTGTYLNDDIDASLATSGVKIDAKDGDNTIIGSAKADTITAGKGDDYVYASAGNDQYTLGSNGVLGNNTVDYSDLIASNTEFGNDAINLNKKDNSDLHLNLTETAYDEQVKYAKDGNNIVVRVMKMADDIAEVARDYDEDLYVYNDMTHRFDLADEDAIKIYKDVAYTGKATAADKLYSNDHSTEYTGAAKTSHAVFQVATTAYAGKASDAELLVVATSGDSAVSDANRWTVADTEIALNNTTDTAYTKAAGANPTYTESAIAKLYDYEGNALDMKVSEIITAGYDGLTDAKKLYTTAAHAPGDEVASYTAADLQTTYGRYALTTTEEAVSAAGKYKYNAGAGTYTYQAEGETVYAATEVAIDTAVGANVLKVKTMLGDDITALTTRNAGDVEDLQTAVLYTGKVADINDDPNVDYMRKNDYAHVLKENIDLVFDESTMIAKDDKGNYVELGTITLKGLGKDNEIADVTIIDEEDPAGTSIFNRDMAIMASKGGKVDGTIADDAIIVGGKTATITGNFGDDEILSTADTNTFNMGKNFGDDEIVVSATSKNTFAFADSAVDSMVFDGSSLTGELSVDTPDGSVSVENLDFTKATLTDSTKGKYSFNALTEDTDLSKSAKGNSISFIETGLGATKGFTVKDSKYNDAVIGSDLEDTFYYTQGGRDLFQGNDGVDTYNVEKMDAKTALTINDNGDDAAVNKLNFTASEIKDVGLLFNVVANGAGGILRDDSDVYFYDRESTTTKSMMDGLKKGSVAGAVRVSDIDLNTIDTTAAKFADEYTVTDKNLSAQKPSVDVDTWIGAVKANVATWLNAHTNFASAMDVFENGTQADVNSLMNAYNTAVADYNLPA